MEGDLVKFLKIVLKENAVLVKGSYYYNKIKGSEKKLY